MYASTRGHAAAVEVLLGDARVDINIKNKVMQLFDCSVHLLIQFVGWRYCAGLGHGDEEDRHHPTAIGEGGCWQDG